MAHGLNSVLKRVKAGGIGSRRIFAPHFKLQVLDSYRNDADCKGNQRATARKYGIHRRQIQKWLQVEGNLRSSVGGSGGKPPSAPARPPDADLLRPPRTPDPLPIDLSLKRQPQATTSGTPARPPAPPTSPLQRLPSPLGLALPLPLPLPQPHPDVWDLSTKRRQQPEQEHTSATSTKAVKLFKPYLDDAPIKKPSPPPAPCCPQTFTCDYYYNNNNNNYQSSNNNNLIICDVKSEYSTATYTLHELQPKSAVTATTPPYYYYPAYPADYDPISSSFYYEDPSQSAVKQRHSYSLDFKLSAIECYYQDSVCKGNQRAVASKYNIHRRQVQKWLKQEDELRQKNDSMKQIVR